MAVYAAVAYVERPGDVDDRGLGWPEAAQHVLGRLQDPLWCEDRLSHRVRAPPRSLSSVAI